MRLAFSTASRPTLDFDYAIPAASGISGQGNAALCVADPLTRDHGYGLPQGLATPMSSFADDLTRDLDELVPEVSAERGIQFDRHSRVAQIDREFVNERSRLAGAGGTA